MEKPGLIGLSFEKMDGSGSGSGSGSGNWDAGYFLAVILLVCGVAMLLAAKATGIGITGVGWIDQAAGAIESFIDPAPVHSYSMISRRWSARCLNLA